MKKLRVGVTNTLSVTQTTSLDHFIEGNFNINMFNKFFGINNRIKEREIIDLLIVLMFCVLAPLSAIFQLYHGDQF